MRRRGRGFWLLWAVALLGISSCGMSEAKKRGTIVGAAIGAVALGAGGAEVGGEFGDGDDDERGAAAGIGVAAGLLLGGALGYLLTSEREAAPPPPPPPPPAAQAPPPPPPPPAPKRIILRGVNFDYDKSNIKSEFVPILDEAAQTLKDNPEINVRIVGHTDSRGSDEYNQQLSERRAQAVKQYLVSEGIAASRLSTEGRGEQDPIAPNTEDGKDNPEGRAMNRRAELKVQ
jgi:outer membrane protein OmpA-like peptidoglycan-associated protein